MTLISPRLIVKLVSWALLFVFFAFHALNGNYGLYALVREQYRITTLKQKLAEVSQERAELEHRVQLMRDDSLDADMLDEQARRTLGVTSKDEVIVLPDSSSK
jgi:cell division protein FtsB